jgi:hypothetical protein
MQGRRAEHNETSGWRCLGGPSESRGSVRSVADRRCGLPGYAMHLSNSQLGQYMRNQGWTFHQQVHHRG